MSQTRRDVNGDDADVEMIPMIVPEHIFTLGPKIS
jgi:hypothetical protein